MCQKHKRWILKNDGKTPLWWKSDVISTPKMNPKEMIENTSQEEDKSE